ncbi:MAG TPA: response regulator [Bacteroidales bacterium]|nr:response regulator [Bacteroidales bacterium]HPE56349.1 response regulator [Bacteroidales bacterium]HRX95526.1 response regulator [Bacteroidales bacterium]
MDYREYEILIVEDSPEDAELMIISLTKNKVANPITVLEDGQEALDFIFCTGPYSERNFNDKPKVIFLDLKLPKVHGLEVLKAIKSNSKTSEIPVVIVTSSKEDPDVKTAYHYGANSYVVKPVNFDEFMETMKQIGSYWLFINERPA